MSVKLAVAPEMTGVIRRLQFALLLTAAVGHAQQPELPAQLSGAVRNSTTGLPVSKATVRLVPATGRTGYVRTTDATGAFAIDAIAGGDYQVLVERRGFLAAAHAVYKGAPAGSLLHLASGQKLTGLDILATPLALVTGTVTDAGGEPVPRAVVRIIAQTWSSSGRRYQEVDGTEANDEGEYRLNGLEPGRYYLFAARPDEGPLAAQVRDPGGELRLGSLYYPNAASIDSATAIELHAGQELTGIAFRLPWVPCFHVRGVTAQNAGAEVQLVKRHNDNALPWESTQEDAAKDQTFDIPGVAPGNYFLRATRDMGGHGVNIPVTVGTHDVNGLALPTTHPEFRAHVRVEGKDAPPLASVALRLEPVEGHDSGRFATIPVQPDGTAHLPAIDPARYTLTGVSRDGGAYLKSVQSAQQELPTPELDFRSGASVDLEIVVSVGVGRVDGTVQWPDPSQSGAPFAAEARIQAVLVPQQPRAGIRGVWFGDIDQNSGFTFSNIPPGKYFAFVTANLDEGLWMNRDFVGLVQGSGAAVELPEKGNVQVPVPVLAAAVAQRAMEAIR